MAIRAKLPSSGGGLALIESHSTGFAFFHQTPTNHIYIIGKKISREIQWRLNQLNSSKYSRVILF